MSRNRASRLGNPPIPAPADPYYTLYQGALSAQWQIDLFGRVRRQSEAAQAQVYASEQGRRGVILTIVTSVAASYIALRALDQQLEIARETAKNYAETARIFDLRFKGGVVSEVELEPGRVAVPAGARRDSRARAADRRPGEPDLGPARAQSRPDRARPDDRQFLAPGIPADLPSTLLERRPDILQAEQTLVAANANIGAAKALYFPTLSLTGLLGSVSTAFGDFLTGPATAWTVAAGLTGPIFTFGLIEGQVQSAEAFQREALASYQQVIFNAFRETNDALVGTVKKREETAAQTKRVAALREYARLSRLRFDNGYAGYLEVLYAENELFAAELGAVQSQAEAYTQIVNVYKAVGGGWVNEADQLAPQPQGMAAREPRESAGN